MLTGLINPGTLRQGEQLVNRLYEELAVAENESVGPSVLDSLTEFPRLMLEFGALASFWPLLAAAPRGDGHAVFVMPGFLGGDESTALLRQMLRRLRYQAIPWSLGRNDGSLATQQKMIEQFLRVSDEVGYKLSVIGQSLGGVYARILAFEYPERIRQIITLGSPFSSTSAHSASPVVMRMFESISGMTQEQMEDRVTRVPAEPPPVPSTAIYSRTDGVVHWSSCLEFETESSESIEVYGSHTGMALNPAVLNVVADRLAQPEQGWRSFSRSRGCRALLYPTPKRRED